MNDFITIAEACELSGKHQDTIRRLWKGSNNKVDPKLKKKWTITSGGMLLINKELLISEYGLNTASTGDDMPKDDTEHIEVDNGDYTAVIQAKNETIETLKEQLKIANEANKDLRQTNAYQAQAFLQLQIGETASTTTEAEIIQTDKPITEQPPVTASRKQSKKKKTKTPAKKKTTVKPKPVKKKRFKLFRRK